MKKPQILHVEKDLSIPWYEQIKKIISFPYKSDEQIYYSIKPSDYVSILAQTRDHKIIIVRQFRPAIEEFVYELPSGHVEEGETPKQAIIRELEEETNCIARNVVLLGENYPDTRLILVPIQKERAIHRPFDCNYPEQDFKRFCSPNPSDVRL